MSKWRAVEISCLKDVNLFPEDKEDILDIRDVYYFNSEEHTHLCELQPSYFLYYLNTNVLVKGGVSEERRDQLSMVYAYLETEDCYMHVSDVDRLPYVSFSPESDGEFEEEEVREYWQGNSPF